MGLFDFFKKKGSQESSTPNTAQGNATQNNNSRENSTLTTSHQANSAQSENSQDNNTQSNTSPIYNNQGTGRQDNSTPETGNAQTSTTDESLESLLQKAATDPACRADFYRRLLTDELFVISKPTDAPAGQRTMQEGETVDLLSLNDGRLPIFTSTDRIYDKGIVKEQVHYIKAPGHQLFTLTKGATLVLNPFSDSGKELVPDEVASLLEGTIFEGLSRQVNIQEKTEVLVGQPSVYPTEMVNAVIGVAKTESSVNAVYLAYIQFKNAEQPPHYLFCVDAGDAYDVIKEKVGSTAQRYLKAGEFINVIKFGTGLNEYFDKVEPFYKK